MKKFLAFLSVVLFFFSSAGIVRANEDPPIRVAVGEEEVIKEDYYAGGDIMELDGKFEKDVYIVQPYKVGTKTNTSLAMVIPSKIVKSQKIDPSTIFVIRTEETERKIILERIDIPSLRERVVSVGKSSEASSQQIPTSQLP